MKQLNRMDRQMKPTAHTTLNEIEIAQLHHGWPQLPDALERTSTRSTPQATFTQRRTVKCTICTVVAQALIAAGHWFELRAKVQIPA